MKPPNLSGTINLKFTWDQLQLLELGLSTALMELSGKPPTLPVVQQRAALEALRSQIDDDLQARVEELKAFDAEYLRQMGQNPM